MLALVLAGSLAGESRTVREDQLRPYLVEEAYRVYDAILPENHAYSNAISVLIRAKTVSYRSDCLDPDSRYRSLVGAAIADYRRVNRTSLSLTRLFNLDKPYEILPESEFFVHPVRLRNSSRWRQYLMGHPDFPGFIELSQVGFDKDRKIAVVYMVRNCGPICSGGDLIVLSRQGDHWAPLNTQGLRCFWQS